MAEAARLTASTRAAGDAGVVVVRATQVSLSGGAQIQSATVGRGQGGNMTVRATDTLSLEGTAPNGALGSGIFANAQGQRETAGDGGTVLVEAPQITLSGGAQIASSTFGGGHGGTVTVMATDTIAISGQGSGLVTKTAGSAPGGNIILQASNLQLTEGATLSAQSTRIGRAGTIRILKTDTLLLSGNSAVTTEAREADGGDIQITAHNLIRLQDSQITTTVGSGEGAGGNITIGTIAPEFVILANSQITANAFGGPGGNIDITATAFLADPTSQVTASSEQNIDGVINIQSPVTDIRSTITPPPATFVSTTALLRDRCAARLREGHWNSLVVTGWEGMPASPRGALPSPLFRGIYERMGTTKDAGLSRQPLSPIPKAMGCQLHICARAGCHFTTATLNTQPATGSKPCKR
jgi:large exoprotein involved in heme utilization and adhesion